MTEQPFQDPGEAPLRRCREGRLVAGVACGLAAYLGLDVAVVRIGIVVLALLTGIGVPLYAAAWLLIPEQGAQSSIAASLLAGWSR